MLPPSADGGRVDFRRRPLFFLRYALGGAIVARMSNMDNAALVLEGGGMRGVWTAGVLDCFLENGVDFNYAIGTSAGASNGLSYASRQAGRARFCNIDALKQHNYIGAKFVFTQRCVMDFNYLFGELPKKVYPFDFAQYLKFGRFILVATDCLTGKPAYFDTPQTPEKLLAACRASCSMPLACPICWVGGRPYLDGGIVDAVPFEKAQADGRRKLVVLLTRREGYRKVENWRYFSLYYLKYPKLKRALLRKALRYNIALKRLEDMQKRGEAFVLRPTFYRENRLNSDTEELARLYENGRKVAKSSLSALREYLEK